MASSHSNYSWLILDVEDVTFYNGGRGMANDDDMEVGTKAETDSSIQDSNNSFQDSSSCQGNSS